MDASARPELGEMLRHNDAALIIGDPGMTLRRDGLNTFDVAQLWRKHTQLGFVFALWAYHSNLAGRQSLPDFAAARDEGLEHLDEIIDLYQPVLGLPRPELQAYLEKNISFSLDRDLTQGLQLFYELAQKHNLINALKPLTL